MIENGKNGDDNEQSAAIEKPVPLPSITSATHSAPVGNSQPILEHHRHSEPELEGKFTVRIKGPGMDSLIVINEEEDLLIVKAMLRKVEKRLAVEGEWGDD